MTRRHRNHKRRRSAFAAMGLAVAAWLVAHGMGRAAEFRLQPEVEMTTPVVTLGDIAQVITSDGTERDRLAEIELFPAPPAEQPRFLRIREIQDLLLLRGVKLAEHRFSGASQVTIRREPVVENPGQGAPLSAAVMKKANRQVRDAIRAHLETGASAEEPWTVAVALDTEQARLVAGSVRGISASGGASPWTGRQRFEITAQAEDGPAKFQVSADVTLPPSVVVAARPLGRGTILSAADVTCQRDAALDTEQQCFHSLDEVIGCEVVKTIGEGRVLDHDDVRPPLLVRRGDVVTVYARSGGIRVRTTARAREEGSLGDLIAIESLFDRKTFFARVSGVRETEIYARAMAAERTGFAGQERVRR